MHVCIYMYIYKQMHIGLSLGEVAMSENIDHYCRSSNNEGLGWVGTNETCRERKKFHLFKFSCNH